MPTQYLWAQPAGAMLLGYLLGSIPFGIILTRAFGAGDLRQIGSGNIGATNVLRTGRKGLAAATLVLDMFKGWLAVYLAARLFPGQAIPAACAAFVGHCYPIWLRFRGGKGVATLMGIALGLYWPLALICAATWLVLFAIVRISSVAGMASAVAAPVAAALLDRFDLVLPLLALALIVLWKHWANIERLLQGTEPRVGKRSG